MPLSSADLNWRVVFLLFVSLCFFGPDLTKFQALLVTFLAKAIVDDICRVTHVLTRHVGNGCDRQC